MKILICEDEEILLTALEFRLKKQGYEIIVISALENDDVVLEAFKLGATDFITKPFKPMELVLRIRKIFQEGQAAS